MQNSSLIRIIVAESHKLIKEGFIFLLNSFQNFIVIDEAEDEQELITKCKNNTPDIILLDQNLLEMEDLSTLHSIKKTHNNLKIILMTLIEDRQILNTKIRKLYNGIISKKVCPKELSVAIQNVMAGDFFLYHSSIKIDEHKVAEGEYELERLTKRENEILYYLAKGLPSKEIAEKLFLSTRTIDSHRSKIIQKYNLHSSSELVHFAHKVLNHNGNENNN